VSTLLNGDLLSHLSLLVSLHYLGKHEPHKFGLFSYENTENNTDLACYIFHIHQPILIIWQKIAVVFELSSAYLIYRLFAITSLIGCKITNAEMTHFQRHWLCVNMPFTKEDKILIKNLFALKGYNARHLVREFPRKS